MSSTPPWVSTNRALANSTIFVFGIFGLNVQSKSARVSTAAMLACLSRRAKRRSARRASSSSTSNSRKLEMWERRGFGLRDAPRQGVDHPGQPEMPERGRELWIHDKKSSRVYWVIGRMAGSALRSGGVGCAGVRSTS